MSERKAVPPEDWPAEAVGRLDKAAALRDLGVAVYPSRFERSHRLGEIVSAYGDKGLEELEGLGVEASVAGRVTTKRGHGKASFVSLSDGESRLQLYVRKDGVGERAYEILDLVDLGDFLGASGTVMRTRKGELSIQARELTFLSKALLPPPEKWHGLADVELRYRQRYLDLMANPEVRRAFVTRSGMVSSIRRFLDDRGYVEVETPMMQPLAGGALARPFTTRHNALGIDLYLRIAPELYLKRLVVGGLEKVYEINRSFRNEGLSTMHNPEFTMLEFYTAYHDCRDVMEVTEALVAAAAEHVAGGRSVAYGGREVSFALPFKRVRMVDAISQTLSDEPTLDCPAGLLEDPESVAAFVVSSSFRSYCTTRGMDPEPYRALSHGQALTRLCEELVEGSLWEPTFIVDHPVETSPLSKARADDPRFADRFELFLGGLEVANGYSEVNDPMEQRRRFEEQLAQRQRGDSEAHLMDDDYIRALGHGLPPTGGCGVGVDRLAMVLTDSPSIRDVILFPHMRPEAGREKEDDGGSATDMA